MEQDKRLREILLNSAEGASANFTGKVMDKVFSLSTARSGYAPLVSTGLKKSFLFAYGAIVTAIVSLCFIIALADVNIVSWIQRMPLPDLNYNKLILFLFIFWSLFTLNMVCKKSFRSFY